MSELHRTGDSATPSEATPDKPEPNATSDTGHDAQIEAILAREDAMPTREESAAASWGSDTPAGPDEPDPASEYDPRLEAALAQEDSLPTREESAAASWGGDLPDSAGGEDPDVEYDARTAAILAREDSMPDRQESVAAWGDTTVGHDHGAPAESSLIEEQAVQDVSSGTDPLTAAADQTGHASIDGHHDNPDSAAPRGPDISPETDDRIKALLVQLDQASAERDQATAERDQAMADIERANQEIANLKAKANEQSIPAGEAQEPSDTDQLRADTSEPKQLAEDTGRSRGQDAAGKETKVPDLEEDAKEAKRNKARGRHVVSPDNIAIGAALWDAQDAVQKIAAHAMHDAASSSVAAAIGITGVALSKIREHRKEKRK
jgi:hypothetical protein